MCYHAGMKRKRGGQPACPACPVCNRGAKPRATITPVPTASTPATLHPPRYPNSGISLLPVRLHLSKRSCGSSCVCSPSNRRLTPAYSRMQPGCQPNGTAHAPSSASRLQTNSGRPSTLPSQISWPLGPRRMTNDVFRTNRAYFHHTRTPSNAQARSSKRFCKSNRACFGGLPACLLSAHPVLGTKQELRSSKRGSVSKTNTNRQHSASLFGLLLDLGDSCLFRV